MKILFCSFKSFEGPYFDTANRQSFQANYTRARLSPETVSMTKGYDVISVFTGDDVSAPVIEELKKNGVKFIAIRAAGYDNVDIDKAHALGIKVANVPAYSPNSVAEHAVSLMLALNRKLVLANKQVHDQNFTIDNLVGFDLYGKTVGIVGAGRIGSVVARILHGFGCRILAYDLKKDPSLESGYHVRYTGLENLCTKSDIITIHTPLNASTRHLFNKQLFRQMKKGVMLINTSRGALVNTGELIEFIHSGHIGYFGMDVYEKEQGLFFYDHSGEVLNDDILKILLSMPNVLITPHQAFATQEALRNIAETTYNTIDCWARDIRPECELPKEETEDSFFLEENIGRW